MSSSSRQNYSKEVREMAGRQGYRMSYHNDVWCIWEWEAVGRPHRSIPSLEFKNVPLEIMNNNKRYGSTKFEVSGLVQGVFFRKFTKAKATELGLTGWCRNTLRGTVEGEYEYEMTEDDGGGRCKLASPYRESVAEFRHWLCKIGSPNSRIDGCGFSEEIVSITRRFDSFSVVR